MAKQFCLNVGNKNTGEIKSVLGYINDELELTLKEYLEFAKQLQDVIREGFICGLKLDICGENQQLTIKYENLSFRDLAPILLRIRPFILENENCFFRKVANQLSRIIDHEFVRGWINQKKQQFSCKLLKNTFRIQVNGVLVNDEKMLNNWLNGMEYHKDRDKRKAIQELSSFFPQDAQKTIYQMMLVERIKAIMDLGNLISGILSEPEELQKKGKLVFNIEVQ